MSFGLRIADIVQIFIIQLNISSNLSIIHKFEKYLRWGNELSFSSLNFFINIRLSNIVWNFGNFSEIVILQKFFFWCLIVVRWLTYNDAKAVNVYMFYKCIFVSTHSAHIFGITIFDNTCRRNQRWNKHELFLKWCFVSWMRLMDVSIRHKSVR